MIDTLTQTNTGSGDKKDTRQQKDHKEPNNFPETDETGEFDFASLAFTPLSPSKLTEQQKPQERKSEKSDPKLPHGAERPEGNHRLAYGRVVKQRRQDNGQRHSLASTTTSPAYGLNQSQATNASKILPATNDANPRKTPCANLTTSLSSRSAPSLDTLRANLAKSTPMTAPKIDRRPLEQQTPQTYPEVTASNKDQCFIQRAPSLSKSSRNQTTVEVARVIPQHPRIHVIQRQSSVPAKPIATGHRLPQLIYEPRSGKQIAQPAVPRATKNAPQTIRQGSSDTKHRQQSHSNGERPISTRVYHHVPYNYLHQYFPSSHNVMTSNHSVKSKDSPAARYDQPPPISYQQVSNPSYSSTRNQNQQVHRPMTTPYRVPANQTSHAQNDNKQQKFSSLPVHYRRGKTDGATTLQARTQQQPRADLNSSGCQRHATMASRGTLRMYSSDPSLATAHSSAQNPNNPNRHVHATFSSGSMSALNLPVTSRHSSTTLPPIYSRYTHTRDIRDRDHFCPSRSTVAQQAAVSSNIRPSGKNNSAHHEESRHSNMHRSQVPPGPQLNFNNDGRFNDVSRCSCRSTEKRIVIKVTPPADLNHLNSPVKDPKTPSRSMPLLLPQNSSLTSSAGNTTYHTIRLPLGNEYPRDTNASITQVEHSTSQRYGTSRQSKVPSKFTIAVDSHILEKIPATSDKDATRPDKCIEIQPRESKETSNTSIDKLTSNLDEESSSDKVTKVRKLIVQCPSTVDARRDKEDDNNDEGDRESRPKKDAPLLKKALKMFTNHKRILAKPGHVIPGPVPPGERTREGALKTTSKAKSRENFVMMDTGTSNDKGKTKSRKKFKIKRKAHDGKKRFASMSRKSQNRSSAESSHSETNKSGKSLKEKKVEVTSLDDWLVEDDENNDDITWYCDFKKSADLCNQRRAARARAIDESSVKAFDEIKQGKLSTTEHAKGSAHNKCSKSTKKKASKRRKITKSKNKVSPRPKNDNDVTEEKKTCGSGRRMTLTSLSAMAWEECREVTMEQWRHCAEKNGMPRKEIDDIAACNKPEAAIEKQNGPPDFQELLVKTWQGVMVKSEQNIEANSTSSTTEHAKYEPSEETFFQSKTSSDDDEDECVDVVDLPGQENIHGHDKKSAFDVFVKNVIDNAERECDLQTSDNHPNQESKCQDWDTWERQVNSKKHLQECRVIENMQLNNTFDSDVERADNEVAAITATMGAPFENQNECDEPPEENAPEVDQEIEQSRIPIANIHVSDNVIGHQPIDPYPVQWNVDGSTEAYLVHNNELIFIDDQSWIGEITEVVETYNNETEVIKVCEKAVD